MMQKSVLRECQKLSAFDQVEREFLTQERHDRDLEDSVMLGLAFQTPWVMENLHHKSCILPDPDIFTFDMADIQEITSCSADEKRKTTALPATTTILDARPAGRFTGEAAEPRAGMRSGHIPNSTNVPFLELLDVRDHHEEATTNYTKDGLKISSAPTKRTKLKSPGELKKIFDLKNVNLEKPFVVTCGSGMTACIVALAAEVVCAHEGKAKPTVSLFDGSWLEYEKSGLPVATSTSNS